ncbi:Chaperonin Cpn60/TCP-1 [Artemisia annua]|uniref:Chaperonin Cpn60/TCP-1 n=1 Tax=Artemisia annua TaxID=35608 RepID=A0A2U1MTU2_ARTAN|nr:Chaperonin Cpn60/TCP-1 [Artemisia annua]
MVGRVSWGTDENGFCLERKIFVQETITKVTCFRGDKWHLDLQKVEFMAEKKFGKTSGNSSANMPPSRRQLPDLEEMLQNEKTEFEEGKKDQPTIDILEINHLQRQFLFQYYVWDHRLVHAASVNINGSSKMGLFSS